MDLIRQLHTWGTVQLWSQVLESVFCRLLENTAKYGYFNTSEAISPWMTQSHADVIIVYCSINADNLIKCLHQAKHLKLFKCICAAIIFCMFTVTMGGKHIWNERFANSNVSPHVEGWSNTKPNNSNYFCFLGGSLLWGAFCIVIFLHIVN